MRLRRTERGAAVVEFAIILPILVMFVIGITEFGRGYNARIELTSAVRVGARAAALGATDQAAKNATDNGAPELNPRLATSPPNTIVVTICPPNPPAGTNATVVATYRFTYTIPFVGTRSKDLTATGVMQCGG